MLQILNNRTFAHRRRSHVHVMISALSYWRSDSKTKATEVM